MTFLYEEKSRQVIGLIYEVRNKLGSGWSEEIYHKALVRLLNKHDVPTVSKPRMPLFHRGSQVYRFEPDIIVWDEIILELKVLPKFNGDSFPSINQAQIIDYLKHCKKDLGILVNFAHSKVGIKRMAYQPPIPKVVENYDYIKPCLNDQDRSILIEVRKYLLLLAEQYGTGYSETIYREIIALELIHQGLKCEGNVIVNAKWEEVKIGSQSIQHLLIENRILLLVKATINHGSTLDFTSTQSFLKSLGLKIGIVINFGRRHIQINGVAV